MCSQRDGEAAHVFPDSKRIVCEVGVGRVEGVMAEHDADVLERYPPCVERAGERAAQVVRPQIRDADLIAVAVDDLANTSMLNARTHART